MIKLTINPTSNPHVITFDQKVVTMGSGSSSMKVDLCLPDPNLEPIHVKIIEENKRLFVINFANDPFLTLNDLPFGKKVVSNQDLLQIGSHVILLEFNFESASSYSIPAPIPIQLEESKSQTANHLIPSPVEKQPVQVSNPIEKVLESNIEEKKEKTEDSYAKVIQKENEPLQEEKNEVTKDSLSITHKKQPTYEVGEFDDESENWTIEKEGKETPTYFEEHPRHINWGILFSFLLLFLFISVIATGILYFDMSAKNEEEELQASESVADIAMALKYAQIHHIKPVKKNWSDPEFIQNSLAQVIPHDYPSLVKIDAQGHLNDTSYSLRIYTSTDFSQFLVIAQPAPSLLQWLIPKTAIVIDSKLMQLRKVSEMKTLNRFLVNSNNLDNSNAVEVTNLVKRGKLIPLNNLAQKRKGQDFSPPKALVLLRPGAENFIYNAPRYYQLGETIMKRAIDLMETPGSIYEMSRLKQDMSLLSKMRDMVLYSSEGIQLTLNAQKAIAAFLSNSRFLTAYLKFDTGGMILSSHLIIDDEGFQYPHTDKKKLDVKEPIVEKIVTEVEPLVEKKDPPKEVHPLLSQLKSLCASRKNTLFPLKQQILAFLNEDIRQPIDGFEIRFGDKIQEYLEEDLKNKLEMAKTIHHLADEYRLMPLSEFISYLNQAGLEGSCQEILKHAVVMENQNETLQNTINDIKNAENFLEIEKILTLANQWLVIKNFSDLYQLQSAQKLIHLEALSRIDKLLLSSMPSPLTMQYGDEHKIVLRNVLQLLLDNPEEQTYFLSEFEKTMNGEEL